MTDRLNHPHYYYRNSSDVRCSSLQILETEVYVDTVSRPERIIYGSGTSTEEQHGSYDRRESE